MTDQEMEDRYGPEWRECREAPSLVEVMERITAQATRERMTRIMEQGQREGGFTGRGVYNTTGREAGFERSRGSYR